MGAMRHLIRLSQFFKPYKGQLSVCVFAVILAAAFGMVSPLMVKWAISSGLNPQSQDGKVIGIHGNTTTLLLACGAIVLFSIARGLSAFVQQYYSQKIGQDVAYDIRNSVY